MNAASDNVRIGNWRLFSPKLDDSGGAYASLVRLAALPTEQALSEIAALLGRAQRWTESGLRLEAAAMVLQDLIALGWQTKASDGWLYVRPGPPGHMSKATARRQLEFGRDDQLAETSNRRFIMSMERPHRASGTQPITALIADGRALVQDLRAAREFEGAERVEALRAICRP